MNTITAMLNLARTFGSVIEVSRGADERTILVSLRYVSWKEDKNDIMARSICGRGETFESACESFLQQARGKLLFGDNSSYYGENRPEFVCV